MKTLIRTAFAIIVAAMAAACAKEGSVTPAGVAGAGSGSTIDVALDCVIDGYVMDDTKAVARNVVRVFWKGGEVVHVYGGKTFLGTLTASVDGTDGTYAKLSGTITAPDEGKPITLLYDNESEPMLSPDGSIFLDFSEQKKDDAHFTIYSVLPSLDGAQVDGDRRTISDKTVSFRFASAVYKCNCACLPAAEISVVCIENTNTGCVINLSDTSEPTIEGTSSGTITRTGGYIRTNQGTIFSVGLPPASAVKERSIVVTAEEKDYIAAFSKTSFASAKAYNALFIMQPTFGRFSVAADHQVYFAPGNLWYDGSNEPGGPRFKLEPNQYDYKVGTQGTEEDGTQYWNWDRNHISHFYWSKNAETAYSQTYEEHGSTIDDFFTNKTTRTANPDFTLNVGGESQAGVWRVLSGGPDGEWQYLLAKRKMRYDKPRYTNCASGVRIDMDIHYGLFIYPDDYRGLEIGQGGPSTWDEINALGIVYLPAAGIRGGLLSGDRVHSIDKHYGIYCSSLPDAEHFEIAYCLFFSTDAPYFNASGKRYRYEGISVRLVRDVK